jgi:hypothetical protein
MAVAAHSVCPAVAWRGGATSPTRKPIVTGIDHDRDTQVAITAAFEFANRLDLGIIAVHAWTRPQISGDDAQPSTIASRRFENDARQHLSNMLAPWRDLYPNIDVSEVVDHTAPGTALLRRAQGAQLVVIGRGRLLAGDLSASTGLNLLHHSTVPVMICGSVDSGDETGSL